MTRRRKSAVVVAVLVAVVLAWEFVPGRVTTYQASFDLTVQIESKVGQPRSINCQLFNGREEAENIL